MFDICLGGDLIWRGREELVGSFLRREFIREKKHYLRKDDKINCFRKARNHAFDEVFMKKR